MGNASNRTSRPKNPSRHFAFEAEKLLAAGQVSDAEELCRRGLIFYPEAPSGYSVLAEIYLAQGDRRRAESVLRVARARTGLRGLSVEEFADGVEGETDLHPTEVPIPAPGEATTNASRPDDVGVEKQLQAMETEAEEQPEFLETDAQQQAGVVDDESRPAPPPRKSSPSPSPGDLLPAERIGSSGTVRPANKPSDYLSLHSGTEIGRIRSSNLRLIPGLEFAPLRRSEDSQKRFAELVREERRTEEHSAPPRKVKADAPPSPLPDLREQVELPPPGIELQKASAEREEGSSREPEAEQRQPGTLSVDEQRVTGGDQLPSVGKREVRASGASADESEKKLTRPLSPLEELARRLETARMPAPAQAPTPKKRNVAFEPSIVSDTFAEILVKQGAMLEALKAYQILARTRPERREEYRERIVELKQRIEAGDSAEDESDE